MSKKDYYETLGIAKNASDDEIKKAYRKLARQYHPDINKTPEAEKMFKDINEANEVLGDKDKRSRYDQYGHAGVDPQYGGFGGGGFGGFEGGFGGFEDLGSIFEAFMGGGSRRSARSNAPQKGDDIRKDVELDFKEAIFGVEKEISITHLENCDSCKGTKAEAGTNISNCSTCGGIGQVHQTQKSFFGTFSSVSVCPKCNGEGKIPEKPCKSCSGRGRMNKDKKIKIKIPSGIYSGAKIRMPNEGDIGIKGGGPGDLYIFVHVRDDKDKIFERRDNDIFVETHLPYYLVALGGEAKVPTLEGETKIDVPAGTQVGKVFTMKGQGVPFLGTDGRKRGDLHIIVNIEVPTKLSEAERKSLEALAELDKDNENHKVKEHSEGFIGAIKNFFTHDDK
ncbi:MAG: molecular chaperone DnaJ [Candidatus Sericytochromatia bacterium]